MLWSGPFDQYHRLFLQNPTSGQVQVFYNCGIYLIRYINRKQCQLMKVNKKVKKKVNFKATNVKRE